MSRHLLPPNRTPLESALADATAISLDPTPLRHLADSTRCPVALLPWLAWAMSTEGWDEAIAEGPRRQLIREQIGIHKRKGTAGAVRRALAVVGATVDFQEWQAQPSGVPYTFGLIAWVNNNFAADEEAVLTPQLYGRLMRLVDATKNERSHYDLKVGARFDQAERFANAQQAAAVGRWSSTVQPVQPTPAQQPLRLANTQHARAVARSSATPAAVQPAAAINPVRLASAARPMTIIRVTMEAQ